MILMVVQYFFIWLRSFSISFLPRSSAEQLHLGVDDDPDGGAVFLHLVKVLLDLLLAQVVGPLGAGLGEGLLLGLGPVLVEPPLALLADVLSPHGLESPHAAGGLDVANHADGDHGRGLDDSDGLNHLLLVVLGTGTIHLRTMWDMP